ncbi:MAG: DUF6455 family protein [Chromatiales bacterium]|jgi:hypothetical protein
MDVIDLLILFPLIVLSAILLFSLPIAIVFNLKAAEKYREDFAARLDELRLSKMLAALGIDTAEYLHNERLVDIHQHMKNCEQCDNTDACDAKLADNASTTADCIGYCNNESHLQQIVEKNSQQGLTATG